MAPKTPPGDAHCTAPLNSTWSALGAMLPPPANAVVRVARPTVAEPVPSSRPSRAVSPTRPSVSLLPNVPSVSVASKRLERASTSRVAHSVSANCGATDHPDEARRLNAGLVSRAAHRPAFNAMPAAKRRAPYTVSMSRAGAKAALPPGACV